MYRLFNGLINLGKLFVLKKSTDGFKNNCTGILVRKRLLFTRSLIPFARVLYAGVFRVGRHGSESVGASRGTPKTEPDVHRPGERGAPARAVVRAQHAPVAQSDRQVYGRVEPHAVPAKVPAARV